MTQQQLPRFEEPEQPDLRPILQLHRRHDGWITFHRKHPETGEHEDLFSIEARKLDGYFPQLLPVFERDSYFSVHGFYRGGFGVANNSPPGLNLKRAERKAESIRWLTCCFADLDCHNLGIDVGTAVGAVISAQDAGVIPPASMLTRSGRGLWCFWFLCAEDNSRSPQRAWPEDVRLWCNVQRAIGDTFAAVGADAQSRDVSRITRIAGSVNSKAEARVSYWLQADSKGRPFVYQLEDLAAGLHVQLPQRHRAVDGHVAKLSERGRKGQRGRWLKARSNFERLWELRGAFKRGTRNNAVIAYVSILRSQRMPEDVVRSEVFRLFCDLERDSKHPYTLAQVESALKTFGRTPGFGGLRNQTIADWLDVTPEESAVLDGWPCASRFGKPVAAADQLSRSEKQVRRRALIQQRVRDLGGRVPTWEELAAWLESKGLPCAPATVGADLTALKIENPRSQKRRKRKRARRKQRNLFRK